MSAVGCCSYCKGMGKMDLEIIRHFSTAHFRTLHYCSWSCLKNDMIFNEGMGDFNA